MEEEEVWEGGRKGGKGGEGEESDGINFGFIYEILDTSLIVTPTDRSYSCVTFETVEVIKCCMVYVRFARWQISWESATIGFWFTDLLDRHGQFTSWLFEGRPSVFWMTGFFNPQGFLTAMRQEITRAHKGWALDAVVLDNDVTKLMKEDITSPPSEGKPAEHYLENV